MGEKWSIVAGVVDGMQWAKGNKAKREVEMLTIHEPEVGQYTRKALDREAKQAARASAKERGYKRARVEFWAVIPIPGGMCLKVQVTASNGDAWSQYAATVAL